MLNINCSRES